MNIKFGRLYQIVSKRVWFYDLDYKMYSLENEIDIMIPLSFDSKFEKNFQ